MSFCIKELDVSQFNKSAFTSNSTADLVTACRTAVPGMIERSVVAKFGGGLHTLQDATSPAHGGFQKRDGHESKYEQFLHVKQELTYPSSNSNLQKITNTYLVWFQKSNAPLPKKNLFNGIKTD